MGWYDELKSNDWFEAVSDVAKGMGQDYENVKHQEAPARQASVLTQTETDQQPQANTWSPAQTPPKTTATAGGIPTSYMVAGGAVLAGLVVLAVAMR